jgi:hypothetical protein
MMRNTVKISVINDSKGAADSSPTPIGYITDATYAIGNYADRGTVAPFNRDNGTFDGTAVNEAADASIIDLSGEEDFVPAYVADMGDANGVSLFAYERRNSVEDGQMYIIVKGTFVSTAGISSVHYFKLDIAANDAHTRPDLLRGRHYILTMHAVLTEGYDTLEEAIHGEALNNIYLSQGDEYGSISDGTSLLNVERIDNMFVAPTNPAVAADFAIRYSYIPDAVSGATDNSGVGMAWGTESGRVAALSSVNQLPNHKVPATPGGSDYPPEYVSPYVDRVSGKLASALPASGITAQSYIRIYKGRLSRTIRINLHQPFNFTPVTLTPASVPQNIGEKVTLTFNIPEELALQLPVTVYIYAPMLAPDILSGAYPDDTSNENRFIYHATDTGLQTAHFTTGSTYGIGYIYLRSPMFNEGSAYLGRN